MKGLRAAGFAALGAAVAGAGGAALIAALVDRPHAPEAIGGATYASVGGGRTAHLVVTSLRTGSAESAAGLHVGDEVASADGVSAPSAAMLRRAMEPGRRVSMTLVRGGDAIPVTLLQARVETRFDEDPADRGR